MELPIEPANSGAGASRRKASGRWRRYSLRGLFLLVTAAAIFCGWVMYRVRELREQKAFIDELVGKGFRIEVEPIENAGFWRLVAGDAAVQIRVAHLYKYLRDDRIEYPTAHQLERLSACTSIQFLQLWGPHVTDEVLNRLTRLKRIQGLELHRTSITDKGLSSIECLQDLSSFHIAASRWSDEKSWSRLSADCLADIGPNDKIKTLTISNTILSDESLENLANRLPELNEVRISDTNVTDRGLLALTRLPKLDTVVIEGALGITDKGLERLAELAHLKWKKFYLSRTRITPEGVRRYQAAGAPVRLDHNLDLSPPVAYPQLYRRGN